MQPNLNERIRQARSNPALLDELIRAHRPLMIAAVRFHMHSVREEYLQIAEDAFREAVAAYRPERGAFLPLCRRIISLRLIDERRRLRLDREIPMADLDDAAQYAIDQAASVSAHLARSLEEERREEIEAYARALKGLGITLRQVQQACPRHKSTRALCLQAVRLIHGDTELARRTLQGRLPIAALCTAFDTGDKVWERHRRYLIAAVLATDGNYPHIAGYILPKEDFT